MKVQELATRVGGRLDKDTGVELTGCASLAEAGPTDVSFVSNPRYVSQLAASRAGAVIVSERVAGSVHPDAAVIVCDDPYYAFRQALVALEGFREQPAVGISDQAYVHETAVVGELCAIRPGAYVAPHADIGDRVVLYPNTYVGKGAVIGNDTVLYPGVCVYDGCVVGDRVILHANSVVGSDGFGYASAQAPKEDRVRHHKIPQAGAVRIEDDVEIGANSTIERAAVGWTTIGAGSKLSDSVVIGHGATIGKHNLLVAHVGIAGSTTTGDYVVMGGQVGVAGHLSIGHRVRIAASSKVMTDIPDDQEWGGTPAQLLADAKRVVLNQKRLPSMAARLKLLEKRLSALESGADADRSP